MSGHLQWWVVVIGQRNSLTGPEIFRPPAKKWSPRPFRQWSPSYTGILSETRAKWAFRPSRATLLLTRQGETITLPAFVCGGAAVTLCSAQGGPDTECSKPSCYNFAQPCLPR